jgi:hypothetical protein
LIVEAINPVVIFHIFVVVGVVARAAAAAEE